MVPPSRMLVLHLAEKFLRKLCLTLHSHRDLFDTFQGCMIGLRALCRNLQLQQTGLVSLMNQWSPS